MENVNGDGVSQYLVHDALRPQLDQWLTSQGFAVDRVPPEVEGDSLPTYLVAPDDERMGCGPWGER